MSKAKKPGRKMLANGRSAPAEHFTQMLRHTMATQAWRALSTTAQALYPWLKLEWRGWRANNNGTIRLSVRQAAQCLGVTPDCAAKAFHELQAKGFLVQTEGASLGTLGAAKSPAWEITELGMLRGEQAQGRKLYNDWRPGHDFPVHKASANNPSGRNGKTKPCHQNHDGTVIEIMTKRKKPS
jgi:hypothetical protein